MNAKRYLTTIVAVVLTLIMAVAETTFRVNAPERVSCGEKFSVTFRLANGEGSGLKAPQINGCKLMYGPSVSTRQSYQMVNGQMSSSSMIDYTYYYQAVKEGSYTIGEASIIVDGKRITTKPQTLTIGPAKPQSSQQNGSARNNAPVSIDDITTQSSDRPVKANDVFVRIILSKPTAYEQEAIECTIKLYTKYNISSFFPTKQPSFDGFLIEELNLQQSINQEEMYNGQRYATALLKKCIIYPQKSGTLTITSGNYDLNVVQYDNVNMGFFTVQTPQERQIKISSNSATIKILPLPEPQPEGFNGAVGKFSIDSKLVGNSFRTNDPGTLIYTISGTGNIKYLKEPEIDFPSEFELYSPQSDITANISGSNVTGKMTIEYTFVPQSVGDFTIGSDKFVYFDVDKKEYVTLTTPTYNIKVAKGLTSANTERQDISIKNTDIAYIVTGDKHPSKVHSFAISQIWYWCIYIALIIALVSVTFAYSNHIKKAADIKGTKLAKANKVARRRLKLAREYMQKNEADKFYEELLRAVWGYLSDKLMIPASQLSRDNISAELTKFGATSELSTSFIEVLDECEMARYAQTSTQEQVEKVYDKASTSINDLESIKRKSK